MVVCDWSISILVVLNRRCSLRDPLQYRLAVVLFDRGYPLFGNFNYIIPICVARVKSYGCTSVGRGQ